MHFRSIGNRIRRPYRREQYSQSYARQNQVHQRLAATAKRSRSPSVPWPCWVLPSVHQELQSYCFTSIRPHEGGGALQKRQQKTIQIPAYTLEYGSPARIQTSEGTFDKRTDTDASGSVESLHS